MTTDLPKSLTWRPAELLRGLPTGVDQSLTEQESFVADVISVTTEIAELLVEKNRKYGNSALAPSRIFSKASVVEQLKVRIDDKLTRLKNQQDDEDEDVVKDLLGYLVILRIAQNRAKAGR